MKNRRKKISLIMISLLIIFAGCKKDSNSNSSSSPSPTPTVTPIYGCTDPTATNYNPSANTSNGTCQYSGKVTFWYNSSGTNATVTINGLTGYVTQYYPTYNPTCGSAGCANFTLPVGAYSYHASSTFTTWNGAVNITSNGCTLVLLN